MSSVKSKIQRYVFVQHKFEGYHRWKDAPEEVNFLRHVHRHEFYVTLTVSTSYNDRDIEFIILKRQLKTYLSQLETEMTQDKRSNNSCEDIACSINDEMLRIQAYSPERQVVIEVSEDRENGAILHFDNTSDKLK